MSEFFTTIGNRKKPANLLRNSKCLGFLLQLEIVKDLVIDFSQVFYYSYKS